MRAALAAAEGTGDAELLSISPWFTAALDIATALGGVSGSVAKAASELILPGLLKKTPGLEGLYQRLAVDRDFQSLLQRSRQDLLDELMAAFAEDISSEASARSECACRAVIFIDTYEALLPGAEADAWVRELFAHLHARNAVLLVIVGKNLLRWPQVDDRWLQVEERDELCRYLDAHCIGGLSPEDTQRYLALSGVGHPPEVGPPTSLQAAIIRCTGADAELAGCHPLFVGLCVDMVRHERGLDGLGADPPPDRFASLPRGAAGTLVKCFLASLAGSELRDLLQSLSAARWFDQSVVEARLGGGIDRAAAAYRQLEQYSFTSPRRGGGITMHALVREALLTQRDDEELVALHEWFRDYWRTRAATDEEARQESYYHHLNVVLTPALRQESPPYAGARDVIRTELAGEEVGEALRRGRFREALPFLSEADAACARYADFAGEADIQNELGLGYRRAGLLEDAAACYTISRNMYDQCDDQTGLGHAWCGTGLVEEQMGDFEAAQRSFSEAFLRYYSVGDWWGMNKIKHCRGRMLRRMNLPVQALAAFVDVREERQVRGSAMWAQADPQADEAFTQFLLGDATQAFDCAREALDQFIEANDRPDAASLRFSIGLMLHRMDRLSECEAEWRDARDEYRLLRSEHAHSLVSECLSRGHQHPEILWEMTSGTFWKMMKSQEVYRQMVAPLVVTCYLNRLPASVACQGGNLRLNDLREEAEAISGIGPARVPPDTVAQVLVRFGYWNEATEFATPGDGASSSDSRSLIVAALLALRDHREDWAGDLFREVIDTPISSGCYLQHYDHALSLLALKETDQAVQSYRRAIEICDWPNILKSAIADADVLDQVATVPGLEAVKSLMTEAHASVIRRLLSRMHEATHTIPAAERGRSSR